jgi:hypothetical protein
LINDNGTTAYQSHSIRSSKREVLAVNACIRKRKVPKNSFTLYFKKLGKQANSQLSEGKKE